MTPSEYVGCDEGGDLNKPGEAFEHMMHNTMMTELFRGANNIFV